MALTDDDIKEIVKGVGGLLGPIHEQLDEHSKRFDKLDERLDNVEEKVERLSDRVDRMSDRIDDNTAAVRSLEVRVSRVEDHLGLPTPRA